MLWNLKTLAVLVVVTWLNYLQPTLRADEQLQYSVELGEQPRRGPGNGVDVAQFNVGLIHLGPLGELQPAGRPKPSRDITAQVSLTNIGTMEQFVYWPNSAATDVFQFEFIHVETGQRIPVLASSFMAPQQPPIAVAQNLFRRLPPGQSVTQLIRIDDRGSGPHAILRNAGTYQLVARLNLNINQAFDEKTGQVETLPNVWTGTLKAEPVEVSFEEGLGFPGLPTSMNGQVRSHDGSPIADAVVQLRYSTAPNSQFNYRHAEDWESVLTDANGTFRFLNVPDESDYSITITCPDYRRGYMVYSHEDLLSNKPLVIEIAKTYAVRGQVVNRSGQSLAMVRVNSSCYTDQDGRFELNVPAPMNGATLQMSLWRRDLVSSDQKISWQEAIASELRLTMFTNEELSVKGQAWFETDEPVANAKLVFNLSWPEAQTSRPLSSTQVSSETDAQGNFVVVLPSHDLYRANIEAEEKSDSGAARRWTCEVERLQPDRPPLQLRFDNRGRIIVRIFQGTKLTSTQNVAVSIHSLSRNRNVAWQRLSANDSGHVFDGLEPGDYRIMARVEDQSYQEFETTVTIPQVEPCRAFAVVRLPKLEYGSLRGRVLMADGQSPANGIPVTVFSSGTNQTVSTDEHGVFVFSRVLSGEISCNVSPFLGQTLKTPVVLTLKPNAEADVGNLVLDATPPGWGTVTGKLSYADGISVEGQTLLNVHAIDDPFLRIFGDVFMIPNFNDQVDAGDMRVRAGESLALFEHHGTAKPRNYMSGGFAQPPDYRRFLLAKVQVEANQRVACDQVIQRRASGRGLTVRWHGDLSPEIAVVVPLGDHACWVYESQNKGIVVLDDEGNTPSTPQSFFFDDIAAGPGHIIFDAWRSGVVAVLPVPPKEVDEITIDASVFGSVEVSIRGPDDKLLPYAKVGLSLPHAAGLPSHMIASYDSNKPDWFDGSIYSKSPDGSIHISGLGPGPYQLQVAAGECRSSVDFQLQPKEHQRIELRLEPDGTLVSSLLENRQ